MALDQICPHCDLPKWRHALSWFDFFIDRVSSFNLARYPMLDSFADMLLHKGLRTLRLARLQKNYDINKLPMRSGLFLQELKNRLIPHAIITTPFGHTDHIEVELEGKKIMIDGLPLGPHRNLWQWEDKSLIKKVAVKNDIPVAHGRAFYFFQKKSALRFAEENGYPLVVKPINGSVSRHVSTNISTPTELERALDVAFEYSPQCLVERYIAKGRVHRAIMVDMQFAGCVQQIPAHVVGNGKDAIRDLIDQKNRSRDQRLYHSITIDTTALDLLKEQGYGLSDIPASDSFIKLQCDPFLKLGGDIQDMGDAIHPENIALFERIARVFDLHLVGIDCIIEDIQRPWQEQACALLEINTLPSIEMHHIPSLGTPRNIAGKLVDMMRKYHD